MDTSTNPETLDETSQILSYDESIPYEDQLPSAAEAAALASRIGSKSTARGGKRKRDDEEETGYEVEEDVEMDDDPTLRGNALLLQGTPISNLPTARLFAYATHFDAHPMGMEWVNDNTCVFVFSSKAAARTGLQYLSKSSGEEPDPEGYITAKPIPVAFWPPEERINSSLGTSRQGGHVMKSVIRMRWARVDDVKKRGAKVWRAKELFNGRELPMKKRQRSEYDSERDVPLRKEQLDDELNEFLAEGEAEDAAALDAPSPPSKMRSDYIASDGRTVLDEPSKPDLASRLMAPLPRRAAKGRKGLAAGLEDRLWSDKTGLSERIGSGRAVGTRRHDRNGRQDRRTGNRERPKKSQQELDDELDAFLNQE
ncbi:hypothetical protein BT96DRAFT_924992 [Gymnopus androsaceus JB14]|uniref:Chromatin target of PRMT1 protein C-terminal domain-containing protein n=1 Tax=Gymnopus androsaceus JB14 TaxID=1447944 RepID=A0A6A4H2M5_9AGAR|nr:hypothetical protein BT96DRAFT_924992 [Gymnopus androsaceus JB14]